MTEQIGIHSIFGAFMLGAMMPKHSGFVRELTEKIEDFIREYTAWNPLDEPTPTPAPPT